MTSRDELLFLRSFYLTLKELMAKKTATQNQKSTPQAAPSKASSFPNSSEVPSLCNLWKNEWPWFLGICVLLYTVYIFCMPHTVTMEDSGEFILNAHFLGVAHPQGYPLYTVLSYLFTWIPWGSVAFRVHLFSGFNAALTCGILYLLGRHIFSTRYWAVAGALCFAFSRSFWFQATIAEVYAFNMVFFSSLLLLAWRLHQRWSEKELLAFVIIYSLSLTNHWPLIILATPAFLVLLKPYWMTLPKQIWLKMSALFALGLTPYLYCYFRSQGENAFSFLGPMKSLGDLVRYIARDYYKASGVEPLADYHDYFRFMGYYLKMLPGEFSWLLILPLLFGVYTFVREKSRWLSLGFLLAFISSSALLHLALRVEFREDLFDTVAVFQLIPFFIASLWITLGAERASQFFLRWLTPKNGKPKAIPPDSKSPPSMPQKILARGMAALVALAPLSTNLKENYLRHDTFGFDFAKVMLESLPPNAVLFTQGDADSGPIAYANLVDGIRPDIKVYVQSNVFLPNRFFNPLEMKSNDEALERTIAFINEKGRIFSTRRMIYFGEKQTQFNFKFNGFFYDVSRRDLPEVNIPNLVPPLADLARGFLDGRYGSQWKNHRGSIMSQVCNYLVLNNVIDPIFQHNRSCSLVLARHMAFLKRHKEADTLFERAIQDFPTMARGERSELLYALLTNRIQLLASVTPEERAKELARTASQVWPALEAWPKCQNRLAKPLLEARAETRYDLNLGWLQVYFGRCNDLQAIWKKI